MDTSTINPFRAIVGKLETDNWQKVTLEYMDWVHSLLKPHNLPVSTYGDIFKVLEFLAENGAIELQNNEDCHLIKRK